MAKSQPISIASQCGSSMMEPEASRAAPSSSVLNSLENARVASNTVVSDTAGSAAGRESNEARQRDGCELTKCVRQMTGLTG
jgi:hypothetical protein